MKLHAAADGSGRAFLELAAKWFGGQNADTKGSSPAAAEIGHRDAHL
jgi:hypothetical protein